MKCWTVLDGDFVAYIEPDYCERCLHLDRRIYQLERENQALRHNVRRLSTRLKRLLESRLITC